MRPSSRILPDRHRAPTPWIPVALAALALLTLVAPTAPARAQVPDSTTKFQVEIFEPQPAQGINLLNLMRSDVMRHLEPSFGLFAEYVSNPLELARQADTDVVVSKLVESQLTLEPWLSLGLFDRVDVGLVLPLVVAQSGQSLALFDRSGDAVDGFALGDLRVVPKVRLIDPRDAAGFGLAIGAQLYLPTGDGGTFNSYGSARFEPVLAIDWRDDRSGFGVAANVGYTFQPKAYAHNLVLDDSLRWGVGVDVPLAEDYVKLAATLHGIVALTKDRDPSDVHKAVDDGLASPIETDAALLARFGPVVAELGGGLGLTDGVGAPDFRAFLSIGYAPFTRDRDGDGIPDREDRCPDVPEDFDGYEDLDGCPDLDNDHDGILDVVDGPKDASGFGACRDVPEDKDGFEDDDGCPDPDNDKDGIADKEDGPLDASGFGKCRDMPEDKDGFEDDDGCPDDDNDGDGIPDKVDGPPDASGLGSCRNDPEDKDGFQDQDGCPDRDNDGDGIPDLYDGPKDASGYGSCRDQPETVNGFEDQDGCPDVPLKRVRVTEYEIQILDKVFFDYNKATIKPVSFPVLDEVAEVMQTHPRITRIRIEGHTDWHGDDAYNLKLSQARAESVMAYLAGKGVGAERMEAKGWGEQHPLVEGAAGRTPDGMAKNRRVEFHIIEVDHQPHSPDKPVIEKKEEEVPQ